MPTIWFVFLLVIGPLAAYGQEDTPEEVRIVVDTARTASLQDIVTRNSDRKLFFVGETHTSFADHLLQLEFLRLLQAEDAPVVLAVEWFQRPFQTVLDRYINGEIDEVQFLRESEYFRRWRYDFRLYRDILRYARQHDIRVLALNASRELTDAVGQHGLTDVPADLRSRLPASYDLDQAGYSERIRQAFMLHAHLSQGDETAFERFLEVQLTWDEVMAEGVAAYMRDNPAHRVLVLAGRGHTHKTAIPARVARRTGDSGVTITSFQPHSDPDAHDYLVLQNSRQLPPSGLIGVSLGEAKQGVEVLDFSEHTLARGAGLEQGDRIVALDGDAVADYIDIKLLLLDKAVGQTVQLEVARDHFLFGEERLKIDVELIGAPSGYP